MPKIQLSKSEIEKFLSLSSYTDITPENITYLPITGYIQLSTNRGFCKMTLTSQNSFISYTFACSEQSTSSLLISYLNLKKFYSGNKRKENLIINDTDKKVTFSDGDFTATYSKQSDLAPFPELPEIKGLVAMRVDKIMIEKLTTAKKYIELKDKLRPILNLVSIKNNLILGSDGHISCLINSDFKSNFSVFTQKEIELISNFDFFDYILMPEGNWNIIKHKTIVFGNRLNEGINAGQMHETIQSFIETLDKKNVMKLNTDQFYNFCKSVKSHEKDLTISSYITVVSNSCVRLSYLDINNDIDLSENIQAEIKGYEDGYKICFVQSKIMKVLDSLDSVWINLSECVMQDGKKPYIGFWLESDLSFHSICSKGFEPPSEIEIQNKSFEI